MVQRFEEDLKTELTSERMQTAYFTSSRERKPFPEKTKCESRPFNGVTVDHSDFKAVFSKQRQVSLFHRMENAGRLTFRLRKNYRACVHAFQWAQNMFYGDKTQKSGISPKTIVLICSQRTVGLLRFLASGGYQAYLPEIDNYIPMINVFRPDFPPTEPRNISLKTKILDDGWCN
ncbi:hypothetical protein NW762_003691 [Fusarium torreyae]|uniref:Uncharacterized protein n=1 Tax=Fusarium torreyae TaxID=1237075 RepID=A0A9W8S885_9HYPO|nr:hypothetical protein NW762_003691 [Fusarium torreyae]